MKADIDQPLVSIGMVVYNESTFIQQSLKSLLAQDYPNLEIMISDNCSSDGTSDICKELTKGDPRVRYERLTQNIGAAENFLRVLEAAQGDYFMWAAGHDLWSPDLISKCVATMEAHQSAAIAYASSIWIDIDGKLFDKESGWYDTRGMDPMQRFFFAFWGNMHPVLGLIRTRYLRDIPKIHKCIGADHILLADLALRGDFINVQNTSWSRRQPRKLESHREQVKRYKSAEFGQSGNWFDRRLPLLRIPTEQMRSILRSPLSVFEKFAMLLAILPAFVVRYLAGRKK